MTEKMYFLILDTNNKDEGVVCEKRKPWGLKGNPFCLLGFWFLVLFVFVLEGSGSRVYYFYCDPDHQFLPCFCLDLLH